jgi:hypothetical protein
VVVVTRLLHQHLPQTKRIARNCAETEMSKR